MNLSSIGTQRTWTSLPMNGGGATVIHDDVNTLTTYSQTYASGMGGRGRYNQDNIARRAGHLWRTLTCALPGVCGLVLRFDNTVPPPLNGLRPSRRPALTGHDAS